MSYELEGEPMLVRRNGAYLLNVDVDLEASDIAAVYEAAADVIRRIQGRADDEKRGGVSDAFHYYDALYDMAEWWSRPFPKAASAASGLAEWCKSKDQHDFTPPADDLRETAQILSDSHPKASKYMTALADWLLTDDGDDFTPPVDLEAIAAAERRGADKREEEIIGFIDGLATTKNWESARVVAELIRQGDHLYGGESDDA